jgi:hypothetical protein
MDLDELEEGTMIWRYGLAWLPMVLIAILNGILREKTYGRLLSESRAHQVSTLTGILLLGTYIWIVTRFLGFETLTQAVLVGALWLGLTIAFEFLFGHFVAKHSWSELLADYNLLAGRLWPLVLLWVAIAPALFYRFLG